MKRLFFLLLLSTSSVTVFSQYITLYEDCNFRGKNKTLNTGRYNLDQVGFGSYRLSSIRVPRGLKVVLYDGPEPGTGTKTRFTSDISCLSSDWNDRAQSIVVESDNSGGDGGIGNTSQPVYPSYGSGAQVIIFEDCGLRGTNANLEPGSYDTRSMRIRNDAISSLRIPQGFSVTVYSEGGFRGESMTFYANVYCLDGRMNNQISSVVVNGPGNNNSGNNRPSYPENNYPSGGDNRVTIYDECSFSGQGVPLKPGRYNYNSMGLRNDKVSSIRVPRGSRIIAYTAKDFQGPSRTFTYDVNCLDGEWNNQISSVIVEGPGGNNGGNNYGNDNGNNQSSYTPPPSGYSGVTVYAASWFKGEHVIFGEGRHDFRNASIRNNISSMAIQPGYRVTVYEEFDFRGRSQTFTSSVYNLAPFKWNDNIRSIVVSRSY
jgi:ribulose bisphosphate carboxylase small subunit